MDNDKSNLWVAIIGIGSILAWFTHVFYCFNHAMWGFLVAGAICVPVAIVHGVYLWFN